MPRTFTLLLALATLSAGAQAQTQSPAADSAGPGFPSNPPVQPAPIVRSPMRGAQGTTMQPIPGVWVRSDAAGSVRTVSSGSDGAEIRLDHGRATVEVRHPAANSLISVDLPGGQTDLIKDGLYTFNADTNTVRVLRGEADAYAGTAGTSGKPVKVKEEHELSFTTGGKGLRAVEADPRQMTADLVPMEGRGYGGGGYGSGGFGPYGDGFAEYPYAPYAYGWGYPYGFYPYGFGYPFGFGLGFGYYGGFRGGYGGLRGGFGRR